MRLTFRRRRKSRDADDIDAEIERERVAAMEQIKQMRQILDRQRGIRDGARESKIVYKPGTESS